MRTDGAERTPVLVVGAGPTGLLLAVELQRRGTPCVLIDAHDAPQAWDRATVVHERSLEMFATLGLADRLIAEGVITRGARFHSDGRILGELSLALEGSRYGFQLGVSEEVTERLLTEALEAAGGSVTRSTRLIALDAQEDGVIATLETAGSERVVRADWVVGCDGLHSLVRKAAGIDYPGSDIADPWAVFDATAEGWDTDYDLVAVHLDRPPVVLTPLPGQRWRIYLRPTSADSDLTEEATAILARYHPGVRLTDIEKPTRFHCHSRVADRFRSGRILIAGDSAHACTPAQGHGMNTGLQDAFNLGWKLAMVCAGEAGDPLLDTYESERRPVAERIVASGAEAEAGQALTGAVERAARDAGIREMAGDPDLAHHEAAAESELDRVYAPSAAVAGEADPALGPGELLPDTADVEPAGDEPAALHEICDPVGLTVLILGGPEADPSALADLTERLSEDSPAPVGRVVGLAVSGGPGIGSLPAAVATQLGVTSITVLAVRPDRYLGFRGEGDDGIGVREYLQGLTAR